MTGPTAPPPTPAVTPPAPAKKPRNRRMRLWLAVGAGVLTLLCLGGVGVAVLLYDEDTKIERAEPDAVVDNFLRSYLGNRDDQEAALNTCKSGAKLAEVEALRTEMADREKNFHVKVSVSWSSLTIADVDERQKSVGANLTIAGSSNGSPTSRRTEKWSFGVIDEDGWRVCTATKES